MTHHHASPATRRAAQRTGAATGSDKPISAHLAYPLTAAQLDQVRTVVAETGDDRALDELIFTTILVTAARPQTVLDLTLGDIDPAECTIRMDDRSGVAWNQPVPDWLVARLQAFARQRGGEQPEDRVFRYRPDSRRGSTPVSRRRLDYLFSRVREHLPWAEQVWISSFTLRLTATTAMTRHSGWAIAATFARIRVDNRIRRHVAVRPADVAAAVVALHGGDHPWLHRSPRPRNN